MARIPKPILVGLVAVALAAAGYAAWRARGPSLDAYTVERAQLVQTVVASGRVESPRRVDVGSALTGTVVSVPVAEGQAVEAGQVLVALDDTEARAAVAQARHAVAQADAKLAQLRGTVQPVAAEAARQAEVNLANAQKQLERSNELFTKGFVGQAALDESQRTRDVARSQWTAARVQLESASPGGMDYRVAETALDQARASLAAAEAHLDLMTVEAPVAGTLISRNVERGNVVQPGKTLFQLSPAGETQLVVAIDEKNLALLRMGQPALASADAYPAQRFHAQVAYINPGVDPARGSVEVKLAVAEPPRYLMQDMTVSVDIEVARRDGALLLPVEAVQDVATRAPWVAVVHDGRVARRAVTLGARGDGRVEIAGGLAEGDVVLPAKQASMHEGKAVRAKVTPAKRATKPS